MDEQVAMQVAEREAAGQEDRRQYREMVQGAAAVLASVGGWYLVSVYGGTIWRVLFLQYGHVFIAVFVFALFLMH